MEIDNGIVNEEPIEMKNSLTVECQKMNGKSFIGTVNYSESKTKIFKDGQGLDINLLETVKISFNKCPVVTFKLKSEINCLKLQSRAKPNG